MFSLKQLPCQLEELDSHCIYTHFDIRRFDAIRLIDAPNYAILKGSLLSGLDECHLRGLDAYKGCVCENYSPMRLPSMLYLSPPRRQLPMR